MSFLWFEKEDAIRLELSQTFLRTTMKWGVMGLLYIPELTLGSVLGTNQEVPFIIPAFGPSQKKR